MSQDKAIARLEGLRQDARDEIKRRIEQRDRYSVQLTLALGALAVLAFSKPELKMVLIAAPLLSIFFTVLVLYSYRIHNVLTRYLRDKIEPELARLCGTPVETEWETFYKKQRVPGIRRRFFLISLWVVSILSLGYLLWGERGNPEFTVLIIAAGVYILSDLLITYWFWKE